MVCRAFFAGALAVLSARAVVAGPCRPVSSSTVEVPYSSVATDSASSTAVASTETLSTGTLSIETSLTLPTTDVTTSTIIQETTTTVAEDFTTTELTTSDATNYQTTESTTTESETTTALETTTTAALAVPTTFKIISDGGDTDGLALQGLTSPASNMYFGNNPRVIVPRAIFTYDEQTSQLSFDSQTLCLYRDDYRWNAQVKTCSDENNDRYTPLLCEKPAGGELKCRMPGSQCNNHPSIPIPMCGPTNEEWSQFFVRPYMGSSYLLYFGIADASDEQLEELSFQPINGLQTLYVDNVIVD